MGRGRECEGGIPLDYLEGLDSCYNNFLIEMANVGASILRLSWDTFGDCVEVCAALSVTPTKNVIGQLSEDKRKALFELVGTPARIRVMITVDMIDEALG